MKYESAFLKEVARKDQVKFTMSAAHLRQHLDELTSFCSGTIEQAADRIIAVTTDRDVRQHALLWKINAIPLAHRAIFYPDPAVALIDAMALGMQMGGYFESGQGRIDLGSLHILALAAARKIEDAAAELARKLKQDGDISRLHHELQSWVARHPIAPDFIHRPTVIPELSTLFPEKQLGTLDMVGSLALSANDIAYRLSVNLNLMPKQARWQMELLLTAVPSDTGIGSGVASLIEFGSVLEKIVPMVAQATEFVAQEREAVLAALARERKSVFERLSRERMAALADIDKQREETLTHLVGERIAAMDGFQLLVATEREAVLASMDRMGRNLLKEAEAASGRLAITALEQSKQVVDHFMLRLAQLTAAVIFLAVLIVVFLRSRPPIKRRP